MNKKNISYLRRACRPNEEFLVLVLVVVILAAIIVVGIRCCSILVNIETGAFSSLLNVKLLFIVITIVSILIGTLLVQISLGVALVQTGL